VAKNGYHAPRTVGSVRNPNLQHEVRAAAAGLAVAHYRQIHTLVPIRAVAGLAGAECRRWRRTKSRLWMERPGRDLSQTDGWVVMSASGGIVSAGIFTRIRVASCMYNKVMVSEFRYEKINAQNILIYFI